MSGLSLPIRLKIPASVIGLSLLMAALTMTMAFVEMRRMAIDDAGNGLTTLSRSMQRDVLAWFRLKEATTLTIAANPTVIKATAQLQTSLLELGQDPMAVLRDAYITRNPYPPEARFSLERVKERGGYHFRHAGLHRYFAQVIREDQLTDIALISPAGDILYTYAKAEDFATNLSSNAAAETPLGQAFLRAKTAANGEVVFSDLAAYAPQGNAEVLFTASPIIDDFGTLVGVLAVQIPAQQVQSALMQSNSQEAAIAWLLIGSDGQTRLSTGPVAPPTADSARMPMDRLVSDKPLRSGGVGLAIWQQIAGPGLGWTLISERQLNDVLQKPAAFLRNLLVFGMVVLCGTMGIGFLLARSISRPLGRLSDALRQIGEGALAHPVPDITRRDEIGAMARTLETTRLALVDARAVAATEMVARHARDTAVDTLRSALQTLSSGDLTGHIATPFPEELETLRYDFNLTIGHMGEAISDVMNSASGIQDAAADLGHSAEDLSRRTETQAATLEETAAAVHELTQSVHSAAQSARHVEEIVMIARAQADQSAGVVQSAIATMTEIEKSAGHIAQIIAVIDDISFQTNLLALNAGVEAARAGDAGKGFAVVAGEVRALAQRTSGAAREIKDLIAISGQQVEIGATRVRDTGSALTRIAGRVEEVTMLVSGIAAAALQQSSALGEINDAMTQLDKVTQQNAAMASQAETAGLTMAQRAIGLKHMVSRFRTTPKTAQDPAQPDWQSGGPAKTAIPPRTGVEAAAAASDTVFFDLPETTFAPNEIWHARS